MKKLLFKITTLIMILALSLSFVGCSLFETSQDEKNNGQPVTTETFDKKAEFGTIPNENRQEKSVVDVISMVKNSVVAITVVNSNSISSGSGVIVDMKATNKEDGTLLDGANEFYILTCQHVISGMGEITVYLPDAESDNMGESDYNEDYAFTGVIDDKIHTNAVTLVGGDEKSDVALLKLKVENNDIASTIVKAKFPSADYSMRDGESVISIGNPSGGAPNHKEVGIISYLFRETSIDNLGEMTLIEHTADIEHGSSGGGLFNMYGELIGITNAGSDAYTSINYAIPYKLENSINGFMDISGLLLASKTAYNYGYVSGRTKMFGFTTSQAQGGSDIVVTSVTANSIAAAAGLKKDDVIKSIAKGQSIPVIGATVVTTSDQVSSVFKSLAVEDYVTLRVHRLGGSADITMRAQQYRFCDTGA